MNVLVEVPDSLDPARLAKALEERGAQLGVDVSIAPA
jgi:predicted amino acid-binding ACT domain protein